MCWPPILAVMVWLKKTLPDKCSICEENYKLDWVTTHYCHDVSVDRGISRFADNHDNATDPVSWVLKIPRTDWMCGACEGIFSDPAGAATKQHHTQRTDRFDTQDESETDTESKKGSDGEDYQGN